ncbi:MAG: diguanylate cyclase [Syntrophales bacterium]|nr:diguanylate cyclase [Syntrophales bacterium]
MKILLAQKNLNLEHAIKRELARLGWEYETYENGEDVYKAITSKQPPCIAIIDDELSGMNGREICKRVRKRGRRIGHYIYIILVGDTGDARSIIEGLRAGADDYIHWSMAIDEIMARIFVGQRLCEYTQDLISENEKIKLISRLEPLTGTFNRSATLDELNIAMYRASRERISLSTVLLDVVGMHEINEEYGSRVGDRILQEVARIISANIRKTDVLGRVGGDDFLVILPGVDGLRAEKIAMRLCRGVENLGGDGRKEMPSVALRRSVVTWDGVRSTDEVLSLAYRNLV